MSGEGSISSEQMRQVLQLTRLLTVTADLDLLLRRIAETACMMLSCERASIFLYDPKTDQLWTKIALQSKEIRVPSGAGIVGHVFKTNKTLHVPEPYQDARFNPEPDRRTGFVTRNLLTSPLLDVDGQPLGVIQAVNKKTGPYGPTDEAMIDLLAAQGGVAIQRYNLQQAAVEATAMRREMELAQAVQSALIPARPPDVCGIVSAGYTHAASMTGGDAYDLWRTEDGRLGIFLGDATGHGIGPALVVSQTRTLIRAMCNFNPDPAALLGCANARLNEDLDSGKFVTAFLGFLSPDGTLAWCSAGHGPIHIRTSPDAPIQAMDSSAPPLGIMSTFMPDPTEPAKICDGGFICVASDGIAEAFSPAGELFGVDRFEQILAQDASDLEQIIDRVREAVRLWQGNDEPKDDQTMVIATHATAKADA